MVNIFDGLITPQMKLEFTQAVDELIRGCELPCKLFYPPTKYVPCANCQTQQGNRGPNPFINGGAGNHTGTCPNCNGAKKIPVENSETINLIVLWNYPGFFDVASAVKKPDGTVETFCKIEQAEKLKRCTHAILNTDIQGYTKHEFIRDSEPEPCGFGDDRYLLTRWKRK